MEASSQNMYRSCCACAEHAWTLAIQALVTAGARQRNNLSICLSLLLLVIAHKFGDRCTKQHLSVAILHSSMGVLNISHKTCQSRSKRDLLIAHAGTTHCRRSHGRTCGTTWVNFFVCIRLDYVLHCIAVVGTYWIAFASCRLDVMFITKEACQSCIQ